MLFLKFRRIISGLMAAVILVSAGAVAVAENKAMPAEFSGTYQFQEVGTLRDVADRVGGLMLKSIDDYIKSSGNKNPNVLSELIEVLLHNAETHNEVHRNRERTDLFYFNEDWFKGNAADGTPDLDMAIMSQQLSLAVCTNAETGADANAFLEKLGFDNIRVYNSEDEGVDTDALGTRFVIAAKPLADGTTLVTVLPDISNTAPSWVDNLDVGSMDTDGIYHGGFSKAAKFAKDCLDEYVEGISGDVKYWITGYSRGGAISNLLSAFLTDDPLSGAEQKDVFTYTFSSPGTVELTESDTTHNNIHNYISKYDIVPALPPHMVSDGMNIDGTSSDDGLTFRRYGVDHIIQDVEGVEETDILEYIYAISPTIFEDYRMHGMATDFAEMEVVIPDTLNLELHGTIGTLTDAIVERMYGANPEDMAGIVSSIDTIAELFSRETAGLLKDFFEQIQVITAPEQIDEQKLNALMTSVHRVLTSLAEYDVSGLTREVENSPTQDQFIYDYDEKIQTAAIQALTTLLDARDGMNEESKRRAAQFKALLNGALTVSHNIKRILYAHYPEVYLSWMRAGAATDENSFYYGGVVAPMGRVKDCGETEFALLGDAKYDSAVTMTGADGVTANVNYASYADAVKVRPGTIDISDINAVGSKTDTETLLSKDIDAGNVLKMEGNISVNKDTYLLENNLTSSELTMRAEGAFKMLFSYLLKGYAELKERAVTGTAANDDSSTDWKAYSVEVKSAKEEDESPSLRMLVDNATAVNTRVDSEANTIVTTRKMFVGNEELMNKTITEWNVTNSGSVINYRVGYDNDGNVSNVCATLKLTIPEDINTLSFTWKNKTQQLAVTPAFGIKSVKVENDTIKSVELKGEPESSAIYVAVYDSAAALKDVIRVDVTKETSYDFDLPLIQNGSYKVLLWGTDMKPIGMME
ncbi:MAG: hypothetical protein IJG16_12415 [Clostridia bacterium]|nr:hypothetical protein [Clostridia bacterium]